jgi:hypothetical protein
MRFLRAFGAFWYDFLVGDRPELFIGSLAVLLIVWVSIQAGLESAMAGWLFTVLVLALAGFSVRVASRPRR